MPTPKKIFDVVGHAKVFSTLDLRAGYHQLSIREEDKAKTTFWGVNSHGKDCLYQWKFLPFGLKNAPVEFQHVMNRILAGLDFVRCYIDDIVVYSDNVEEHQIHLQIVFERLKVHGLRLHLRKCKFFQESVEYLGHVIYPGGLGVQQAKVEAIARILHSTNVNRVHAFMGLTNYYRMYVKGFSAMAKPLNLLLKLDQEWQWGDE
jgi:putative transposase